ncbi:class I adenylate-forming enzyme family protein [Trueperella bialowiezensis]|uniref:Short-chain-fatty-acid--CoA ligase n=1 Tax=Trueperella bialowiezensis TaxID=312285 RepID=A0A448PFC7_9ACTO|nr:class I adenylate-forming enzyme family protein [Trueperella bialowiezensis]VEI13627.1 Short-chain-fatty-acid--CoA ligase [Trueperella bialowiezensis]
MIVGDTLWPSDITADIREVKVYNRTVRTYVPGPQSLYETLADTAAKFPDKIAIYAEDGNRFTFAQVRELVDGFAGYLAQRYAITTGKRVGVLLDNGIDFITVFYATNRLGAIIVPLPGKFRRAEIDALSERARLDLVVCQPEQADWFADMPVITTSSNTCAAGLPSWHTPHGLEGVPMPVIENDAVLLFTSGTTSLSKGVLLTNMNAVHAVRSYARVLDLSSDDTTIIAVPIYHVTGMIAIIGLFVYLGGAIHIQKRMEGRPFVKEIYTSGVSFVHASPTVFAMMLEERDRFPQLPSVQKMACGAAHMPVTRIAELHEWMPHMQFRTVYGLTETCSPAFVFPCDAATSADLGSSGMPIPGLDVMICDDDTELPIGEVGEIVLRGANIARRYDGLETEALSEDGWLRTGDIGRATPGGYIYVLDRKKDMINRGGEKIWCIDVEEELRRLDGVEDACVVGVPDPFYGEVAAAAVVLRDGEETSEVELKEALNKRLARYQVPVYFRRVPAIPLTPGSKVDKRAVRALFADV